MFGSLYMPSEYLSEAEPKNCDASERPEGTTETRGLEVPRAALTIHVGDMPVPGAACHDRPIQLEGTENRPADSCDPDGEWILINPAAERLRSATASH